MEESKNIYAALAAAQTAMGPALRDSMNPAFKSRYADLASVFVACLPALNANGIAVFQPTCEIDGARVVKTVLAHSSGETIECVVPLIIGKNDMQGYGSAVTYARRYGLMCMAGIAPEDDDGNAAAKAAPQDHRRDEPKRDAGPTAAPQDHRRDEPKRDAGPTAAQVAAGSLANADTLDQLAAIWKDIPRSVQGDASVIKAKDDRKAELTKPNADLDGENLPY